MASNERLDRLNALAQAIDTFAQENNMRSDELMLHLSDLISHLIRENTKKCITTPLFADRTLYIHDKVKESMNMAISLINSKRNTLRSLAKEVKKKRLKLQQ